LLKEKILLLLLGLLRLESRWSLLLHSAKRLLLRWL
jgi:hypothetical protein